MFHTQYICVALNTAGVDFACYGHSKCNLYLKFDTKILALKLDKIKS